MKKTNIAKLAEFYNVTISEKTAFIETKEFLDLLHDKSEKYLSENKYYQLKDVVEVLITIQNRIFECDFMGEEKLTGLFLENIDNFDDFYFVYDKERNE